MSVASCPMCGSSLSLRHYPLLSYSGLYQVHLMVKMGNPTGHSRALQASSEQNPRVMLRKSFAKAFGFCIAADEYSEAPLEGNPRGNFMNHTGGLRYNNVKTSDFVSILCCVV